MTASILSQLLAEAERDPTNSGLHLLAAMDIVISRDWGGERPIWRGVSWQFGELAEALIAHAIALDPSNPELHAMRDQVRAERQRRSLWGKLRALFRGNREQIDPFKKTFVCPICGWPGLANPPFREPLWSDQDDCPCCGFEMEVDSEIKGWSYENYRAQWILDGMPWWSPTSGPPRGLDKESQLASIGVDARSFAEEMIKDGFPVGSRLNEDGPDWHRHYVCPCVDLVACGIRPCLRWRCLRTRSALAANTHGLRLKLRLRKTTRLIGANGYGMVAGSGLMAWGARSRSRGAQRIN